jgi:hypothetical protein
MSVTKSYFNVFLIVTRPKQFDIYFIEVDEQMFLTLKGCSLQTQPRDGWFDQWIKEKPTYWDGAEMHPISSTCHPLVVRVL